MFRKTCAKHKIPQINICARDGCRALYCNQCMIEHSLQTMHNLGVKLNEQSKEFYLLWNKYLLQRLNKMIKILETKDYTQVFDVLLKDTYNFEQYPFLDQKEVDKIAKDVLIKDIAKIQNNILTIQKARNIEDLMKMELLVEIYNTVLLDSQHIFQTICQSISNSLKSLYPYRNIFNHIQISFKIQQTKAIEIKRLHYLKSIQKNIINQFFHSQHISINSSIFLQQKRFSVQKKSPQSVINKKKQSQQDYQTYFHQKSQTKRNNNNPQNLQTNIKHLSNKNKYQKQVYKEDKFTRYRQRFRELLQNQKQATSKSLQELSQEKKRLENSPNINNQYKNLKKSTQYEQNLIKQMKNQIKILNRQLINKIQSIKSQKEAYIRLQQQNIKLKAMLKRNQHQLQKLNEMVESNQLKQQREKQKSLLQNRINQFIENVHELQSQLEKSENQNTLLRNSLNQRNLLIKFIKNSFPKDDQNPQKISQSQFIQNKMNYLITKLSTLQKQLLKYKNIGKNQYTNYSQNQFFQNRQNTLLAEIKQKDTLIQIMNQKILDLNHIINQTYIENHQIQSEYWYYRRKKQKQLSQLLSLLKLQGLQLESQKQKKINPIELKKNRKYKLHRSLVNCRGSQRRIQRVQSNPHFSKNNLFFQIQYISKLNKQAILESQEKNSQEFHLNYTIDQLQQANEQLDRSQVKQQNLIQSNIQCTNDNPQLRQTLEVLKNITLQSFKTD